eukprot:scaffold60364_cov58-Phaeocystis_antarctica.AAC.2
MVGRWRTLCSRRARGWRRGRARAARGARVARLRRGMVSNGEGPTIFLTTVELGLHAKPCNKRIACRGPCEPIPAARVVTQALLTRPRHDGTRHVWAGEDVSSECVQRGCSLCRGLAPDRLDGLRQPHSPAMTVRLLAWLGLGWLKEAELRPSPRPCGCWRCSSRYFPPFSPDLSQILKSQFSPRCRVAPLYSYQRYHSPNKGAYSDLFPPPILRSTSSALPLPPRGRPLALSSGLPALPKLLTCGATNVRCP